MTRGSASQSCGPSRTGARGLTARGRARRPWPVRPPSRRGAAEDGVAGGGEGAAGGGDDLEESGDDLEESGDDLEESGDDFEESGDDFEEGGGDSEKSRTGRALTLLHLDPHAGLPLLRPPRLGGGGLAPSPSEMQR